MDPHALVLGVWVLKPAALHNLDPKRVTKPLNLTADT